MFGVSEGSSPPLIVTRMIVFHMCDSHDKLCGTTVRVSGILWVTKLPFLLLSSCACGKLLIQHSMLNKKKEQSSALQI